MAIKINFDNTHNAINPTLVLATRNGERIGALPNISPQISDGLSEVAEIAFEVYQNECSETIWEKLTDFKLIWVREWNRFFEIYVDLNESDATIKNVTAQSLGEAELSQIYLYNIEINTETDIERDDYSPTVLYNPDKPSASLINRCLEKAPHYTIGHVDDSIKNIQRTFSFNGTSIYDSFLEVSEEIGCLFVYETYLNDNYELVREINVYDLESYCLDCGYRGDFTTTCEKCGSTNILTGYGDDTSIYVSVENLAEEIEYSVDTGSVKNCFRLEAGDDLMTAAVISCNPNGSSYIWYISDELKEDMSDELVAKLDSYDALYEEYQTTHETTIPAAIVETYNSIIDKYVTAGLIESGDYNKITNPIVGLRQYDYAIS